MHHQRNNWLDARRKQRSRRQGRGYQTRSPNLALKGGRIWTVASFSGICAPILRHDDRELMAKRLNRASFI